MTPFVGREREIQELLKLLTGQNSAELPARLITLVGVGGVGKTRLAIEVVTQCRAVATPSLYTHGVFFVPLAPLHAPSAIIPTIAEALGFGFRLGSEPKQQLLVELREKNVLLIMDQCERWVSELSIINEILQVAPRAQIIATSRERLRLPAEQVYTVQGLDFPQSETGRLGTGRLSPRGTATLRAAVEEPDYDAARLFAQCARRIKPNFTLSQNDSRYLKRICRLVQGIPLGIELAAAWVDMFALEEIAAEIAKNTDFLATDAYAAPERQRSLRAVFSYSWNVLGETEQKALQQLSVFRGGFTGEAAHAITGASLGALAMLAHKSFVSRGQTSEVFAEVSNARVSRYELHELMRQYAATQLEQAPKLRDAVRERHSAYYLDWLHHQRDQLGGDRSLNALTTIAGEINNARVAWDEAVAHGRIERLTQAIDPLCHFYERRGRYVEGEEVCRAAVHGWGIGGEQRAARGEQDEQTPNLQSPMPPYQSPALQGARGILLVKALAWQGAFCHALGRTGQAKELLRQSLTAVEQLDTSVREAREAKAFALERMERAQTDVKI